MNPKLLLAKILAPYFQIAIFSLVKMDSPFGCFLYKMLIPLGNSNALKKKKKLGKRNEGKKVLKLEYTDSILIELEF